MRRKSIFYAAAAITLSLSLFIPSVQAFAVSALSVFRVGDTKTIVITLADLDELAAYAQKHESLLEEFKDKKEHSETRDKMDKMKEHNKAEKEMLPSLNSVSEFTWFSVRLPEDMSHEAPDIYALNPMTVTKPLEAAKINQGLSILGDTPLLDYALDGAEITLHTPPSLFIAYDDLTIQATQLPYVEAEQWVKESIKDFLLNMPFLSYNLRSQLANIGVDNRDIYLPVIRGLGREVSIRGIKGYVYTMSDFAGLMEEMPMDTLYSFLGDESAFDKRPAHRDYEKDVSVLVWTHNDVLYVMAGAKTDNELVRLAASMRSPH